MDQALRAFVSHALSTGAVPGEDGIYRISRELLDAAITSLKDQPIEELPAEANGTGGEGKGDNRATRPGECGLWRKDAASMAGREGK